MDRVIAFDVETPNCRNDRMSAIGITVVEGAQIVQSFASLVQPDTYFDRFNVGLTGITPQMVEGAPDFYELWQSIGPVMQSGILIAHNAPFDMGVLSKCLAAYCIDAPRYLKYACTVRMSRRCFPKLPDHRLDTMCRCLDIPLDHHRAESDSMACAKLYVDLIERGLLLDDFIRTYDTLTRRTLQTRSHGEPRI